MHYFETGFNGHMVGFSVARRSVALGLALAGLLLTGCASSRTPHSSAMMGGGSEYHYSALSCAAPPALPGHTVNVTLADMGMTQMMNGTAPVGAHMMLRATPATVAAGQVSLVASNMGWRKRGI
jgi:hypothetical protein